MTFLGIMPFLVVVVLGIVLGVLLRYLGKINKNKTNVDVAKSVETPTQQEKDTVDDIKLF